MLIANPNPNTLFHKQVSFSTVDEITDTAIIEGYIVSNPYNTSISVVPLTSVYRKVVVPLTNQTGDGSPYLKFHFTNAADPRTMFITFCVKNSYMQDGFYDYKTGIPAGYKTQLRTWIKGTQAGTGTKQKVLRFTAYGDETNKPQEAVTFYVTFQATFSKKPGPILTTNSNPLLSVI